MVAKSNINLMATIITSSTPPLSRPARGCGAIEFDPKEADFCKIFYDVHYNIANDNHSKNQVSIKPVVHAKRCECSSK